MAGRRVLIRRSDGRVQHYRVSFKNFKANFARVGRFKRKNIYQNVRRFEAQIRDAERRDEQPQAPEPERPPLYRVSLVVMTYSTLAGNKTPTPFAEFRVTVYTLEPDEYPRGRLENRLFAYMSSTSAGSGKNMRAEIEGFEQEQIDEDERLDGHTDNDRLYFYSGFHKKKRDGSPEVLQFRESAPI